MTARPRPTTVRCPGISREISCSGSARRRWPPLVDRATRFTTVVALPDGYNAVTVAAALIEHMAALPPGLRRSLTWDRGKEMAAHATITAALSMPVFFCDPHHPWQRGTNENTNRLLRQYLHKNADLSAFTQADLDAIAAKLNHRPRRVLGWATPAEASAALGLPEPGRSQLG